MLHPWDMLPSSVTDEYGHAGSSTPTPHKRLPWNKGKLTGAKPPLRPKDVWSVWTTFQIEGRARDLTMFNLAIDSKLRGSNLAHERPLCAISGHSVSPRIDYAVSPQELISRPALQKHPAGKHVCGFERHDVVGGQHGIEIGDEAVGLAQSHAVQRVPD